MKRILAALLLGLMPTLVEATCIGYYTGNTGQGSNNLCSSSNNGINSGITQGSAPTPPEGDKWLVSAFADVNASIHFPKTAFSATAGTVELYFQLTATAGALPGGQQLMLFSAYDEIGAGQVAVELYEAGATRYFGVAVGDHFVSKTAASLGVGVNHLCRVEYTTTTYAAYLDGVLMGADSTTLGTLTAPVVDVGGNTTGGNHACNICRIDALMISNSTSDPYFGPPYTSPTPTASPTPTRSPTPTASNTPTATPSSTGTPNWTATATHSPTRTATRTPSLTSTLSGTPTFTNSPSPTRTATPTHSPTRSPSPSATLTRTVTSTRTNTPIVPTPTLTLGP